MKAYGSQIIAEFIGCRVPLLARREELEGLLAEGIERHGLELKALNSYQFQPEGVTAIAIIGASHVALHSYPEARHLSLDIFTCSPGSPQPERLLAFLRERLEPELVRSKQLTRGLSVELSQADYLTGFGPGSFDIRYHVERELLRQRSRHQQITIIDNRDFGRMLFLDQELQIASADATRYQQALLEPLTGLVVAADSPLRLLILGGGDGYALQALLARLGARAASVTVVDIDPEVVAAAREHLGHGAAFEDPRVSLHLGDAVDFLAQAPAYDAIVCDLTSAPERLAHADQASYHARLFAGLRSALAPGGLLCLQLGSARDRAGREMASTLMAPGFEAIELREVFIPSFCEARSFASARRAGSI